MKIININSTGKLYINSKLVDGTGIRVTNDFLITLVKEFAKQTTRYMKAVDSVPFVYKERQLHSMLAPALSRITDIFLMEYPLKRNWTTLSETEFNDSHGWVDYWCHYRDIIYFIELKHGFISSRRAVVNEDVKEKWKTAIEQLEVINEEAISHVNYGNGVFRIALEVIPIYETVTNSEPQTIGDTQHLLDIQEKCMKEFDANWSIAWQLHNNLVGPYEFTNTKECYPAVLFMAKVLGITK